MSSNDNLNNLLIIKNDLFKALDNYLSESARQWLQDTLQTISTSDQVIEDLGLYSAMAKRKLGSVYMDDSPPIDSTSPALDIQRWTIADTGRIIMLISAIETQPEQTQETITAYYKMGDESERIALIRSLLIFAPGNSLTELALDAGRTNSLEILAALTLDNPYPARFYSESEFNQMVLKGLFLGLAIERVVDLSERANPELSHMCENYVIERENANRTVPVDIWLAIGPFASDTGKQQIMKYLTDEDIGHRYYCAFALIKRLPQDSSVESVLKQRMDIEQDPMIINLLQQSLSA